MYSLIQPSRHLLKQPHFEAINYLISSSRFISKDFTNKRITRIEGDLELESDIYKSRLINRNPLNLEQLCYEKKPNGFWLDEASPSNYNRLIFKRNGRYLEASLQHWSGRNIIHASTKEKQLSKYFNGANTIQAATILAQVIARRCLMSGFLCAGAVGNEGIKSKVFFETVESSGFSLQESPEISPRSVSDL